MFKWERMEDSMQLCCVGKPRVMPYGHILKPTGSPVEMMIEYPAVKLLEQNFELRKIGGTEIL
jgi:hypothetical protein